MGRSVTALNIPFQNQIKGFSTMRPHFSMPYDSKQVSSSRGSQLVPLKTEIGNLFSYLQNENQQFQIPTFQIF